MQLTYIRMYYIQRVVYSLRMFMQMTFMKIHIFNVLSMFL